ncbi:cytochrome c3 family protein [Hyphomicrobium sp.]|uniref:cytochrome c3 family protein n=1 Tax=Hyphomicrobium sp. TaxID=82 RepID=UPI000FA59CDD|nr:cytochrome c3 family protein [Hyphomicrobium sp.]RUP10571.1 MAG: hypothetical protein EKK38_03345 [Hyphomicrobium sp.]
MWRFFWPQESENPKPPSFRRDRLALLVALITAACTLTAFFLSKGTHFLMPGPLTSAHASIENCSSCHGKSSSGKLSWIHGLVAGDPIADSKTCMTCHKMPATAFFPHDASPDVLIASTKRLTKTAATTPEPLTARAQNTAFPAHDVVARGLTCATCHQEHQGTNFNLSKISNEQCRSCHVVKFESFDSNHPQFENYPFDRRTRIIYDHASHFDKHFPEVAKKDATKPIPATCSTCHDSQKDRRIMSVAPFDKTCSGCHLDQITGNERATGPKGIAFLALPGLDLETLKMRNAAIGEWPDASEAELTPFMKVMISRSEKGRALIKTVDRLNLQDLTNATDEQVAAVKDLIWEIKRLIYALISGKASDVLGYLNTGGGAKLSPSLVADLTASIPRDVIVGAQQQWLPNLAREITGGPVTADPQPIANDHEQRNSSATAAEEPPPPNAPQPTAETGEKEVTTDKEGPSEKASGTKYDPPACVMRVFGQCLMSAAGQENKPDDANSAESNEGKEKRSAGSLPEPMRAGLQDAGPAANSQAGGDKATNQSDDLLRPTEEELREMKSRSKDGTRTPQAREGSSQPDNAPVPQAKTTPVISIESNVDPESWAEYGGWYRQDYAIFYRPAGHKDKFVYSWLSLTGPEASKGDRSPAAAVFDFLTTKDAQGSCTKCHSVDDIRGKGRTVNFSPPSTDMKLGRFTTFIHQPHLGVMQDRGCLTCHSLQKGRPYLKSYEQGNPHEFTSNFGAVSKDLCQACHASNKVRQDCMTCHKYHVNGVITPIMQTKIPMQ